MATGTAQTAKAGKHTVQAVMIGGPYLATMVW